MERAVILGAGFISHTHAEALKKCGIEVYAVVDQNEAAAKEFAKKWDIPNYGSDMNILFDEAVTTVHVCTPPDTHYNIVKKLLLAKKNVLCEKPLCFLDEEAKELVKLAKDNHCRCATNLNVRFHNMSQKMKDLVQSAEFGPMNFVHGKYLQEFHILPTFYNWRYIPELAGKMRAVTEIGTHWFDIVQYVSGQKITAVSATFGSFNQKRTLKDGMMYPYQEGSEAIFVDSEDVAIITLRFDNQSIGSVVLSEVSHGYSNYLSYEMTGHKMTVGWNSQENNEIYINQESKSNVIRDGFGNGFNDSFHRLIESFYNGDENCPTFDEGARIVRICNAVYESATHNSMWVEIKEE